MSEITFFHIADLHLESPFTTLAKKEGFPKKRRNDLVNAFFKVIEEAKNQKPDFLFISGDLFEHEYARGKTISLLNKGFCEIEDTKVVMISGNHDMEASNSFYKSMKWNDNVYYLGEECENIYFEELNTIVYGVGFGPGFGQSTRLENMTLDTEKLNVLLFHGDIDLNIGDRDYNSVTSSMLKHKKFDYVAAGHNHKTRADIGQVNIIYNPGSLEPLGFDEEGKHGYFIGKISKEEGVNISFVENNLTEYIIKEIDISEISSDKECIELIENQITSEKGIYKIKLTGTRNLNYNPEISIIGNMLNNKASYIDIIDNTKIDIPIEEISLMKGIKGIFTKNILEELENTTDEKRREILIKALYYGIEAIEEENITLDLEEA